jgi:rRNA maturation endonuclease Nob1
MSPIITIQVSQSDNSTKYDINLFNKVCIGCTAVICPAASDAKQSKSDDFLFVFAVDRACRRCPDCGGETKIRSGRNDSRNKGRFHHRIQSQLL